MFGRRKPVWVWRIGTHGPKVKPSKRQRPSLGRTSGCDHRPAWPSMQIRGCASHAGRGASCISPRLPMAPSICISRLPPYRHRYPVTALTQRRHKYRPASNDEPRRSQLRMGTLALLSTEFCPSMVRNIVPPFSPKKLLETSISSMMTYK